MGGKAAIKQTGGNIMENKPLLIGGGVVVLIIIVLIVMKFMELGPFSNDESTPAPE